MTPETLADRALCLLCMSHVRTYLLGELERLKEIPPTVPRNRALYRYRRYVQSKLIAITTQMLADRAVFPLKTLSL